MFFSDAQVWCKQQVGDEVRIPEAATPTCSAACSLNPELAVCGMAVISSAVMAPSLPTQPTVAAGEAPSPWLDSVSWGTSSPAGKSVSNTP